MCIGVFYYVLGDIRPQFRAKLTNIQLLLITKYDTVKEFGMLQPIVDDLKKLESVCVFAVIRVLS